MKAYSPLRAPLVLAAAILLGPRADAGDVQLAGFAGIRFGGSFYSIGTGQKISMDTGFEYGGALDIPVAERWALELFYARDTADLDAGLLGAVDLTTERYMVGIREEKGQGMTRYFGVFRLGMTRFSPGIGGAKADSDMQFTVGVGLGTKIYLVPHLALRAEVRGYFVVTESEGATACINGTCVFRYGASGLWQGDLTGGLVIAF